MHRTKCEARPVAGRAPELDCELAASQISSPDDNSLTPDWQALVRHLHRLGPQILAEFLRETVDPGDLEIQIARYSRIDPAALPVVAAGRKRTGSTTAGPGASDQPQEEFDDEIGFLYSSVEPVGALEMAASRARRPSAKRRCEERRRAPCRTCQRPDRPRVAFARSACRGWPTWRGGW